MLVLSRQPNQTVMIGGTIEILFLDVRGDRIRLGIRAPQDIEVLRGELLSRSQPRHERRRQYAFVR